MGNYIYENGLLQFFNTPEGYVTPKIANDYNEGFDHIYQYKDHLGNIRLSYMDNNGNLEIVEENNYYPFGLKHKGYNSTVSELGNNVAQKWKFGGKEYDDSFGLETYDFGVRNYSPDLGRWMNLDPLAEGMRRFSPYNYAWDSPINVIDPDGMWGIFINEEGEQIGDDGKDDGKVYVVKTDQSSVESGAPIDGISSEEKNDTVDFITANSGNTEAFENNSIAYDNSVEIEGSEDTRQNMVDIVNQDDGTGGSKLSNSQEYGGVVQKDGSVIEQTDRKSTSINTDAIATRETKSSFHSHPSADSITESNGATEGPSHGNTLREGGDINPNRRPGTNYVFERKTGKVYIYNSRKGVQAIIPQKNFVKQPKKGK